MCCVQMGLASRVGSVLSADVENDGPLTLVPDRPAEGSIPDMSGATGGYSIAVFSF